MANLKDIIYISNEDYETLVTSGTVTINGSTLTYDEDNLYITPDKLASTTEDGLMSAADKAKLDNLGSNVLSAITYEVDAVTRPTSSSDYVVYHITAPNISASSLVEGFTLRVHKSAVANWPNDSGGAIKLLQINSLDPIAIFWRYDSFAAWNNFNNAFMTLSYSAAARSSTSNYYGYTSQAGFLLDYTYDSGNDQYTLYDFSPFTVGSSDITSYSFTGYDVNGKRVPIVNSDGTFSNIPFVYGRGIQLYDGSVRTANTSYNAWNGNFYSQFVGRTMLLTAFVNAHSLSSVSPLTSLYFKCTLSGITMTVVGVTTTLPSTEDGYYYMFVGKPYSTYSSASNQSWVMSSDHPIYVYKNGAVRNLNDTSNTPKIVDYRP